MNPVVLLVHFLGGALLANAIPHGVHGISGHRFQTPFAKPPGRGESSPIVNVVWSAACVALGWVAVHWHRGGGARSHADKLAVVLGAFAIALTLAWWFGKVRGSGMVAGDSVGH